MKLDEANGLIKKYVERMDDLYGGVVFDEWTMVSFRDKTGRVLSYQGPRKENFQKSFSKDIEELKAELLKKKHEPGDFEFARHGTGQLFDAFIVAGPEFYLIWNATEKSMQGIAKDSRWLKAQVAFLELAEKFRADSVTE
ncbi:MAG: hypothetical protein ABI042_01880 [Verrucomicrobiota bacterium]